MLQPITNGSNAYEVSIYNRDVRAAVKDNESHVLYGDQWADLQFQDVHAESEKEALKLILRRYPPENGFVIQDLNLLDQ